jgi:hypothetical protein
MADGFILFGTPHFCAGLGQWALLSAKHLRIPCAKNVQQQDWSETRGGMNSLVDVQKAFRDSEPAPRMVCYFALLPDPESGIVREPLVTG